MITSDFERQTNEFLLYCRTTQPKGKSMMACEQPKNLLGRRCRDETGGFLFAPHNLVI